MPVTSYSRPAYLISQARFRNSRRHHDHAPPHATELSLSYARHFRSFLYSIRFFDFVSGLSDKAHWLSTSRRHIGAASRTRARLLTRRFLSQPRVSAASMTMRSHRVISGSSAILRCRAPIRRHQLNATRRARECAHALSRFVTAHFRCDSHL